MKSIIILLSIILASSVQAAQVLNCKGGAGGPTGAQVKLVIEPIANDQVTIAIQLSNSVVPNGLEGTFEGQYYTAQKVLVGDGKIGDIDANISLSQKGNDIFLLNIYAGANHTVEYGFGAHFSCN